MERQLYVNGESIPNLSIQSILNVLVEIEKMMNQVIFSSLLTKIQVCYYVDDKIKWWIHSNVDKYELLYVFESCIILNRRMRVNTGDRVLEKPYDILIFAHNMS